MAKTLIPKSSIPPKQLTLLLAIIIIALPILFYSLYYADKRDEIQKQQIQNQALRDEIQKLEESRNLMLDLRKEADQVTKRFELLRSKIPSTTDELNLFLASISQRAQSSKITKWNLFKQEALIPADEVSAVPIRMEFISTFEAANAFFWELSNMGDGNQAGSKEQIVNVKELVITKLPQSTGANVLNIDSPLQISCIAETYLYTGQKLSNKTNTR